MRTINKVFLLNAAANQSLIIQFTSHDTGVQLLPLGSRISTSAAIVITRIL
ncbi:hypothetical protein PHSC3_001229 [Chlamydiales bacterium STE3]|nr:hypothetical protein PHSC3_001229 [Chlamydiales bacterium STE3]